MATGVTWSDNSGKSSYVADSANFEVLMIVSECESHPNPDVVQRRAASELTEEWRGKLENQGIARVDQHDDLSLIKARYILAHKKYTISGVEMSNPGGEGLTRDRVLKKIRAVMNCDNTRGGRSPEVLEWAQQSYYVYVICILVFHAVGLYYVGAGKRGTGDWCFEDGFITFRDIANLYLQLLRGHVLAISIDCSHSGSWVRECMTFMDEQGVQPCGHSARDKGILISVYASCLSHQVPRQLAYSVHGIKNDKNTGFCTVLLSDSALPYRITDHQHSVGLNFTEVRCGAESIFSECQCIPQADWKMWSVWNRIIDLSDPQSNVWALVLVVDDDETLVRLMDTEFADFRDYSEVLKIGYGEKPTKEEFQTATQKYAIYKVKNI